MTTRITTTHTIEELGARQACGIECEITWALYPAEPMVRYYADGSGYPGYPAHGEPLDVKVTAAWGDTWMAIRRHPHYVTSLWDSAGRAIIARPDWLDWLQPYCEQQIESDHFDQLATEALEAADKSHQQYD